MTRRCAAILHEARIPLLIVNRTLQAAEELARSVSGRRCRWIGSARSPGALRAGAGDGRGEPVLDAQALGQLKVAAAFAP